MMYITAKTPAPPDPLRLVDETLKEGEAAAEPAAAPAAQEPAAGLLAAVGRWAVTVGGDIFGGLAFLGRVAVTFARRVPDPRRLRPISIARHVYDTGVTAIPIVALIAFLISVILAYLSAQQLRSFGADIFVVDLVTIGVLRELGVLLTAIIVAGPLGQRLCRRDRRDAARTRRSMRCTPPASIHSRRWCCRGCSGS